PNPRPPPAQAWSRDHSSGGRATFPAAPPLSAMPRRNPLAPPAGRSVPLVGLLTLLALLGVSAPRVFAQRAAHPGLFRIEVVDAETGRGVPLVELTTVNNLRFLTDSAGNVAIAEPDLLDEEVWFTVRSHGYQFPADGFGFRGLRLKVTPGEMAQIRLPRLNIARRLYRVTGGGLYADSVWLGLPVPVAQPVRNTRVIGQDSVLAEVFQGQVHWFWGDTNRPAYPLGNFHVPGATSQLPADGGLPIERGIDLRYFANADGFARETARLPGDGPTWLAGLAVLPDGSGRERMFAGSMKVRNLLEVYARGLVEWNATTSQWEQRREIPLDTPCYPIGHVVRVPGPDTGWAGFAHPLPWLRIPAHAEAFLDPRQWEAFTCLQPGSKAGETTVERDADGHVAWGWKRQTAAVWPVDQPRLLQAKTLANHELAAPLRDVETGRSVVMHAGSTSWNPFRQRYVMIANELGGSSSLLGEVWYSEAATPLGPWSHAVKIATHEKYSFYNPRQHPFFDSDGGRLIVFEGTYATTFSGNTDPTPRYDYNQVLYQLDLADPRLAIPSPLVTNPASSADEPPLVAWTPAGRGYEAGAGSPWRQAIGFAPQRPRPGCWPLVWQGNARTGWKLLLQEEAPTAPDQPSGIYAWPVEDRAGSPTPAGLVWLLEESEPGQPNRYSVSHEPPAAAPPGAKPRRAVARLWPNPWLAKEE
ncbi:MAG: hypothetical protein ACKOJF_33025, partial [Planctomycetaceae bacterium]